MPKTVKTLAVIATAFFAFWLLFALNLRGAYVNLSGIAPLGMIDVLFPYYWVILLAFVSVCFVAYRQQDSPRWLHIFLLAQLALMLYYTPFLLGGFSWSPDSLWHGGVANYMPSILSGSNYYLTEYAQSYPLSFLVTYGVESFFSLDVVTYTLYVFPPICIVLISSLAYFFGYRVFNKSTAFLAMLFALPALHYIEPHVSPFATGTVLLLASLVLLTYKSVKTAALSLILIVAVTLTHPISPIFLGIYLFVALLVTLLFRWKRLSVTAESMVHQPKPGFSLRSQSAVRLMLLLLFLGAFWAYWTICQAAPSYIGVQTPVSNVLDLTFVKNLSNAVEWTASGQGFIYPQISQMSLFIYGIFLVAIVAIFGVNFFKFLRRRPRGVGSALELLTLTVTAIGSAVMSYLLFSSSGERYLLGRGLIFFLLMGSMCIATYFAGAKKHFNLKTCIAFMFILFLFSSYPVIAYSKEAYNTFTPSSEDGLVFLSDNIDLSNKTLSMTSDQQLAAYADLSKGLHLVGFPPSMHQMPGVIVLRDSSYYLMAMRYDLSLTKNDYVSLYANLTDNPFYDKVYSNQQFEVFVRTY